MTKEEIDEEILDAAAALFARHGVGQTSVQRIADAVGYSKTGLLHRFPSKDALQDATVAHTVDALRALARDVDGLPVGPARDRRVVEALADLTTRRPGLVAFALSALSGQEGGMGPDRLEAIGDVLFGAFGERLTAGPPDDRSVRITTAVGGLAVASLACADLPFDQVRPHLVAAALGAIGRTVPTEEN